MQGDAPASSVCGVILAGGAGTRMGGVDKGLVVHRGRALVEHVFASLAPQVEEVAISANRSLDRYAALGVSVWRDDAPDFPGPLAGIATALRRAAQPLVLTVPVDAPSPPEDLAARLVDALDHHASAQVAYAHDGSRSQPLFALYRRGIIDAVLERLAAGERAVHALHGSVPSVAVDFADVAAGFRNLNAPTDLDAP